MSSNVMKNSDYTLQQYKKLINVFDKANEQINNAKSFENALQLAVDIIREDIGWDVGHVYAIDRYGRSEMISMPIWSFKHREKHLSFYNATETIMRFGLGYGLPGEVLRIKQPFWYKNIQLEQSSPRRKLCADMSLKGAFAFPVIDNNVVIAVLEFFSEQEMHVDDFMLRIIRLLGSNIGTVLSRKHIEKQLKEQTFALDQSSLVIKTDKRSYVIDCNEQWCDISRYKKIEILGKKISIFNSGYHDKLFFEKMYDTLQKGNVWQGNIKNKAKNGEVFWIYATIVPLLSEKQQIYEYLCICKNITERKKAEDKIKYLAYYDSLTDLPNREKFNINLLEQLIECKKKSTQLAVLFIDIDNFKFINDSYGHSAGDQLLKEAAVRLHACLRKTDQVYTYSARDARQHLSRLGGDEFTVIIDGYLTLNDVAHFAQRIIETFSQPFTLHQKAVFATVSIGIAMYPEDGLEVEALIKNADIAMYHAKKQGKSNFQFYAQDMKFSFSRKLTLENYLRRAVENQEFQLFYQAKYNLKTKKIDSLEALLRWFHPELGMIPPDEFIYLAEETNLIIPIGEWVLHETVKQINIWINQGYEQLRVDINVSAKQFRRDLAISIEQLIHNEVLNPANLGIEITEGSLMISDNYVLDELNQLKNMGIYISIDDFGTGYSSLRYLSRFPINALKIDRSFIKNIPNNKDDTAIAMTILSLAKNLNLDVIAEGVEEQVQSDFLEALECDYIQGYLISKPMPADKILPLVASYNKP
ncbi:MAG: hypothetical protein Tsb005_11530 [Gammaproteobacteria bacterium]